MLDDLRAANRARRDLGTSSDKKRVASELAEVLICLDILAEHLDIDLSEAVRDTFNAKSVQKGLPVFIFPPHLRRNATRILQHLRDDPHYGLDIPSEPDPKTGEALNWLVEKGIVVL